MNFSNEKTVESNFHFMNEHNIEFEKEYIIHRCQIDVCEPESALDKLLTVIVHRDNTLEVLNIGSEKLKFYMRLCCDGKISLKNKISESSAIQFKSYEGTFSIDSEHEISFTNNDTVEGEGIHIELNTRDGMFIKGLKRLSIGYLSIYGNEDVEVVDVWE